MFRLARKLARAIAYLFTSTPENDRDRMSIITAQMDTKTLRPQGERQ